MADITIHAHAPDCPCADCTGRYEEDGRYCSSCDREGECAPDCPDREYAEFVRRNEERLARFKRPSGYELRVEVGSEGPRHDPYSYRDYRITRPDGVRVRGHFGLGEELWLDGEKISHCEEDTVERFELLAGFPIDVLDRWDEMQYDSPCMACGAERGCRGRCQE